MYHRQLICQIYRYIDSDTPDNMLFSLSYLYDTVPGASFPFWTISSWSSCELQTSIHSVGAKACGEDRTKSARRRQRRGHINSLSSRQTL